MVLTWSVYVCTCICLLWLLVGHATSRIPFGGGPLPSDNDDAAAAATISDCGGFVLFCSVRCDCFAFVVASHSSVAVATAVAGGRGDSGVAVLCPPRVPCCTTVKI